MWNRSQQAILIATAPICCCLAADVFAGSITLHAGYGAAGWGRERIGHHTLGSSTVIDGVFAFEGSATFGESSWTQSGVGIGETFSGGVTPPPTQAQYDATTLPDMPDGWHWSVDFNWLETSTRLHVWILNIAPGSEVAVEIVASQQYQESELMLLVDVGQDLYALEDPQAGELHAGAWSGYPDNLPQHLGFVPTGALRTNFHLPTNCPGDLNQDGNVGPADMAHVLSVWGPCPGCTQDLDDDHVVGPADLAHVLSVWGPCPPAVCPSDAACYDGDSCTADACDFASGTCTHTPITCDDGGDCTLDACSTAAGCIFESLGPINDHCQDRIPIFDGDTALSNVCADTDGPEHEACDQFLLDPQVGSDMWFNYVASCEGTLTVSTCDNDIDFDTKLALYAGVDCGTLEESLLDCNDDTFTCDTSSSRVEAVVTADAPYLIRVGGFLGAQGTGVVSVNCVATTVTCAPGAGNCCDANGTPGCEEVSCCETICAQDAFCCATGWDNICAGAAATLCPTCEPTGPCGPGYGDCCTPNGTPGCNDTSCCVTVCIADPYCCNVSWDSMCMSHAYAMCSICD